MNHQLLDSVLDQLKNNPKSREISEGIFAIGEAKERIDLTISTVIHGNEIIGLEILNQLLPSIFSHSLDHHRYYGIIIGNIQAIKENKRFIEKDLNRCFLFEDEITKIEELRAKEIEAFATKSKFIFDIHQTTAPCLHPFWLFQFHPENFKFAYLLDKNTTMVSYPPAKFSDDGFGFSSFAIKNKIPFLTIELGQAGIEQKLVDHGKLVLLKLIEQHHIFSNYQLDILEVKDHPIWTWGYNLKKSSPEQHLVDELKNMDDIKINSVIAKDGEQLFLTPIDGKIIFPKYGPYLKASTEIVRILKKSTFGELQKISQESAKPS